MSEFDGYPSFEDWLDAVRVSLYEQVKDMTTEEELAFLRAETEPVMKEFHIQRATLQPVIPHKRERAAM
ncbi:MAG: hypothetical protein IJT20_06460 [Synergistaceae bacterium]|nr:hypothetical protein [Synergistaceae bacterium]